MLVVVYARVSTEEQARTGFSLAEQLRACRGRAAGLSGADGAAPAIAEFTDDASGELLERPGLQAALELMRGRQAACFVCLDPDRLARRLMHQLLITDQIEAAGCRLEFVQHDYHQTAEGRLFYQLRGAIAEFEKAKILERTARGRRGKVAAGGLPHVIRMYGYRFINGAGKQAAARDVLVPEPREAQWVRQMYNWCTREGLGPGPIAARLNGLGVATKTGRGPWTATHVRRILRHPAYATGRLALGRRDHRGLGVARRLTREQRRQKGIALTPRPRPPESWQHVEIAALVGRDAWEQAQAALENGRLRAGDANAAAGAGGTGAPHGLRPLSGLGRCGLCGDTLYYLNGRVIVCAGRYRHCWPGQRGAGARSGCTLPAKPRAAVEQAVWERVAAGLLARLRADEECRRMAGEPSGPAPAAAKPAALTAETAALTAETAALAAELASRAAELERLGLLYARGLWPAEQAWPAMERARQQMDAIRARLAALARETAPAGDTCLPPPAASPAERRAALEGLDPGARARFIRAAVARYELHPTGRGRPPAVTVHLRPQPAWPG